MIPPRAPSLHLLAWVCRWLAWGRLPVFMRWWGAQLFSLVPLRWRARLFPGGGRVYCEVVGSELSVTAVDIHGERELHRWPLAEMETRIPAVEAEWECSATPTTCWMLLPSDRVLRPRIALPLAAEGRLHDVVAFEIDRQTPFSVEQVVFDQRVLVRDEPAGKLIVEMVVLPKTSLESALATMPNLGLAGVDVRTPGGSRLGVNLLPVGRRLNRRHPATWLNLVLMAITAMGLVFMLGKSLDNRTQAVESLRAQVDEMRVEAGQVAAMREQLTMASDGANFLGDVLATRPAVLEVLTGLTNQLPDGTWLEKLTIDEGHLSLVIYSNEAAALVKKLQEAPYLTDPALSGAIQADERSGRDRFTLTAALTASDPKKAAASSKGQAPTKSLAEDVDAASL